MNANNGDRPKVLRADLPSKWLSVDQFEDLLRNNRFQSHLETDGTVVLYFPENAAVPAGLGLWLLSFLNQLAGIGRGQIHLEFAAEVGLFSYLDRNGFLQLLSPSISTSPMRPFISSAEAHRGKTIGLVEIAALDPGDAREDKQRIVGRVVDNLVGFYPRGEQTRRLGNHVFTVLGELVDNVFSHSHTRLPGYVSLQAYNKRHRPRIQLGVSDSGIGIPASIRGTRAVAAKADADLVVEAFMEGLSRHGSNTGRGCGLPQCAALAARYGSTLFVRTPSARIVLNPASRQRPYHKAEIDTSVGRLDGTHIYLEFRTS